jgi:hypothetical protein
MALKSDLVAYQSRWKQVDRFIQRERRTASFELRWKQLNAAYSIGKSLGWLQSDQDEMKVFQTWAGLKEKAIQ